MPMPCPKVLNILSWNVWGLNDPQKICLVIAYLNRHSIDIGFLQETHMTRH